MTNGVAYHAGMIDMSAHSEELETHCIDGTCTSKSYIIISRDPEFNCKLGVRLWVAPQGNQILLFARFRAVPLQGIELAQGETPNLAGSYGNIKFSRADGVRKSVIVHVGIPAGPHAAQSVIDKNLGKDLVDMLIGKARIHLDYEQLCMKLSTIWADMIGQYSYDEDAAKKAAAEAKPVMHEGQATTAADKVAKALAGEEETPKVGVDDEAFGDFDFSQIKSKMQGEAPSTGGYADDATVFEESTPEETDEPIGDDDA